MTTDYTGATDEIKAIVLAAWQAATLAVLGGSLALHYQGIVQAVGGPDEYWARVSLQTVLQEQAGVSSSPGSTRHTAYGIVFVQMFFPLSVVDSWRKGTDVANRVKNALALPSSSGTVWFRKPRINELLPDLTHHRLNVVAEFEYDEIV